MPLNLATTVVQLQGEEPTTLADYVDHAYNNQQLPFDARRILTTIDDPLRTGESDLGGDMGPDMKVIAWGTQ